MPTMGLCPVCNSAQGHSPDCGASARRILAQVLVLAAEADIKGTRLQEIPELKLVGTAYCGMSERIFALLDTP